MGSALGCGLGGFSPDGSPPPSPAGAVAEWGGEEVGVVWGVGVEGIAAMMDWLREEVWKGVCFKDLKMKVRVSVCVRACVCGGGVIAAMIHWWEGDFVLKA